MRAPFSLCVVLLADSLPSTEALRAALPGAPWAGQGGAPLSDAAGWLAGAPGQVVPAPGGGRVLVDWLRRPYPDGLGVDGDPGLQAAAAAGAFGPGVAPGALARAVLHSPELGATIPSDHAGFLRLRWMVGVPGADQPAAAQLEALLDLAAHLMGRFPESLRALFVPSGELAVDAAAAARHRRTARAAGVAPIGLAAGLRVLRVGDAAGWVVMDSVGQGVFGLPDLEVAFLPGASSRHGPRTRTQATPPSVAGFLRDLGLYLLARGEVLLPGHLLEGPGSRYRVTRPPGPLLGPPRRVLRLMPLDMGPLPALLDDGWRAPEAQEMPRLPDVPGDDAAIRPPSFDEADGDLDGAVDDGMPPWGGDDDMDGEFDGARESPDGLVTLDLGAREATDAAELPEGSGADRALDDALAAALLAFDADLPVPGTPTGGRRR